MNKMKALIYTLFTIATFVLSVGFAAEVRPQINDNKKPVKIQYCDNVATFFEPMLNQLNKDIRWLTHDIGGPLTHIEMLSIVKNIPGMALRPAVDQYGKVYHKVLRITWDGKLQTTTRTFRRETSTISSVREQGYNTQLAMLLGQFTVPHGLEENVDKLTWMYMRGGCELVVVNPQRWIGWLLD